MKAENTREENLAPNWNEPYRIRQNVKNGAYKVEELLGKVILEHAT